MLKKRIVSIGLITVICCGLLNGCKDKSDVDMLVGTWKINDLEAGTKYDEYVIEFYEPYEAGGTCGDLGYINTHNGQRKGTYSYHESSKTLELSLYNEFNVPNDWTDYLTMTLEIVNDDCIQLQSDDYVLELTKYEN